MSYSRIKWRNMWSLFVHFVHFLYNYCFVFEYEKWHAIHLLVIRWPYVFCMWAHLHRNDGIKNESQKLNMFIGIIMRSIQHTFKHTYSNSMAWNLLCSCGQCPRFSISANELQNLWHKNGGCVSFPLQKKMHSGT